MSNPNRSLNFSVTGVNVTVEPVNDNQPLKAAAQRALDQAGKTRPLSDYDVMYNNQVLDITQTVGSFNFPDDAVIFLSLKSGQGGKD